MGTCATNLMDAIEKNSPCSHAHGTIAYISETIKPSLNKLLEHERLEFHVIIISREHGNFIVYSFS